MKKCFLLTFVAVLFFSMNSTAGPSAFFQNLKTSKSTFIRRPFKNSVPHSAVFHLPENIRRYRSRRLATPQPYITSAIKKTGQVNVTLRYITTSGNGASWINSNVRNLDHFSGEDIISKEYISFITLAHSGSSPGEIFASQVDVFGGLENGTIYTHGPLNSGIEGSGGHYPGVVTLERPFVSFNQSLYSGAGMPPISHPFTINSTGSYGDNGSNWTTPDYQMDVGWLNPTLNNFQEYKENRLWDGAVAIVRDGQNIYRYIGVYETRYSQDEKAQYGVQDEKYILTAHSITDDPSDGWTFGWQEDHDPVWIDTAQVTLLRCGAALNENGFGVIAGPGYLGGRRSDSTYRYEDIRITYATTDNYGLTWSDWDTVSLTAMGIPSYIYAQDQWIIESIDTINHDTTWYEGPAFLGCNLDMSVLVDYENNIYVGFNSLWGVPASKEIYDGAPYEDAFYPHYKYSGVLLAHKPSGQDWEGMRIAYNNGVFEGDDYKAGMCNYFFDSEIQLALSSAGDLHAFWLDRRRNGLEMTHFNRYDDPETTENNATFKTDIYSSLSVNQGHDWSEISNCTDSPHLDEYELNLAPHAVYDSEQWAWFAYCLADTAGGDPATDSYTELPNDIWAGELVYPPLAVNELTNPTVASFALQQNYPNPFNPATRIRYRLAKPCRVELTVFNLIGEKIETLVSKEQQPGTYKIEFNGANLPSGVYFYKITAGAFSAVRKMILVK